MFGALDLTSHRCSTGWRNRKRFSEVLDFLRQLHRHHASKLHVISDNFSPHKKAELTAWSERNNVELVHPIVRILAELDRIRIRSAVLHSQWQRPHQPHRTRKKRSVHYIRWNKKHTMPKTNLAISSKIRKPNYLPKAA